MNYDEQSVNRKLEELNSQSIKYRRKFSTIAGTLILVTVLSASVIAASVGYGMLRGILDNTPEFDPNRVVPTGFYSVIYNSRGDEAERLVGSNANRVEAKYDEFPQDLVDAFVAIEDSRFWQHEGIDFRSILRAITGILTDSYSGGGSTITQQLIKNTVFEGGMENSGGARLERKIQEQYLALQLTKTMDRKTILTNYLNTINLGNDTLGVKSAAMRYFGKDVADLTLSECAVIAGITQNPSRYNPITHPEENNSRREVILGEMYRQGYITREEQDMALSDKVYDRIQNVNVETTGHRSAYSYYTDELIEQVKDALKERYGYTDTQAYNMIYTGGLRIYTPQDPDLQAIVDEEMKNPANYDAERFSAEYRLSVKSADGTTNHYSQEHLHRFIRQSGAYPGFDGLFNTEEELKAWVEQYRNSVVTEQDTVLGETLNVVPEPQASFVLIEQSTGYVRAISGGRGEKNASRTLNRATDTLRQPGSTFKIITTFAPALDTCGATLATTYYDAPYSFGSKVFKNWWGDNWTGYQNIRDGIIYSMNIVALKCMAETVTPQLGVDYAKRMGITTLSAQDLNLSTALGGITKGVTNLDLTNSFATIAAGGIYRKPLFFTRITDRNGKLILDNVPEKRQVLKESTAWLLTDAMAESMKANTLYQTFGVGIHSTGTAAAIPGMSCAGKSGTTSDNVDVWFVGYTPYYTAGIWGGCDANQTLKNADAGINNGGTNYHKRIWNRIMTRIHDGMDDPGFLRPADIVEAEVCRKSGKLPVAGVCENDPRGTPVYTEYFAQGTVPTEVCDRHVRVTICKESGERSTDKCPAEETEQKTFMVVPENEGDTDDSLYVMPDYCILHDPHARETDPERENREDEEEETEEEE